MENFLRSSKIRINKYNKERKRERERERVHNTE